MRFDVSSDARAVKTDARGRVRTRAHPSMPSSLNPRDRSGATARGRRSLTREVAVFRSKRALVPRALLRPLRLRVQRPPGSLVLPQRPRADDEQDHQSPDAGRALTPWVPSVVPRFFVVVLPRRRAVAAVPESSLLIRLHPQRRRPGAAPRARAALQGKPSRGVRAVRALARARRDARALSSLTHLHARIVDARRRANARDAARDRAPVHHRSRARLFRARASEASPCASLPIASMRFS